MIHSVNKVSLAAIVIVGIVEATSAQPLAPFTNLTTQDLADTVGHGRGAAWADYDNDGDLDLYVTNWLGPNLMFANENGVLIDRSFGIPKVIPAADIDGDGFVGSSDLASVLGSWNSLGGPADVNNDGIVNAADLAFVLGDWAPPTNSILRNPGATNFSGRAIWGDYDNDGDADLFICSSLGSALLRNDGVVDGFVNVSDGTSLALLGKLVRCAAWADWDNDGDLDMYISATGGTDNGNHLFRNDGNDVFVEVTTPTLNDPGVGRGVSFSDVDGDGDLDLYLSNGMPGGIGELSILRRNRLWLGDGAGGFVDASTPLLEDVASNGRGVAFGDYDNDGDFDLYLSNVNVNSLGGGNRLLQNDGAGGFTNVTTTLLLNVRQTRECSWIDFDNDADLDLFLGNAFSENLLLRNDGAAGFVQMDAGLLTDDVQNARAVSWADYDQDGDLDVYLCNIGSNYLFRNDNDLVSTNHWLEVRLTGTVSNRDGIGAKVFATTGSLTQMREVRSGEGYLSQHMMIQHFGLANETVIDTLRIEWPSGQVQTLMGVAADQILDVIEPTP